MIFGLWLPADRGLREYGAHTLRDIPSTKDAKIEALCSFEQPNVIFKHFLYGVAVCERITYSATLSASAVSGLGNGYFLPIDYIYILHKCTCAELHQSEEKHFLIQCVGETTHILRGKKCKIGQNFVTHTGTLHIAAVTYHTKSKHLKHGQKRIC